VFKSRFPHAPFAFGYWIRRHGWSITWDPRTTSPMRLPPFIGCAYQRGSRTRSPCCRTKSSTEVRPGIWDPSCLCQISPVDGRCVLRIPVGFSYHPSNSRQSAAEPSRLPVPASGTPCRKKSRRHRHRWSFADASRLGCSGNRSQTSLSDLRLLYLLFCIILLTLR